MLCAAGGRRGPAGPGPPREAHAVSGAAASRTAPARPPIGYGTGPTPSTRTWPCRPARSPAEPRLELSRPAVLAAPAIRVAPLVRSFRPQALAIITPAGRIST